MYERKTALIQEKCRRILQSVSDLGNAWLSSAQSYHEDAVLCAQIAAAHEDIREEAQKILNQTTLLRPEDAQSAFASMEAASKALAEKLSHILTFLEANDHTAAEMAGKRNSYEALLQDLTDGTRAAVGSVQVLPETDHGGVFVEAFKAVEYYLYGAESFYLPLAQQEELRRLYGVHGTLTDDLETIGSLDAKTLKRLNLQFRSAKKRTFDQEISREQRRLSELWTDYISMYEKLHGTLDGTISLQESAQATIALLEQEIERMQGKYLERVRQDMLQELVERALRKSKRGMRVRRLGEDRGTSGNSRTLYSIGESGTCLEVYTDARGQILLETGGITDGEGRTRMQEETMERNNRFFCDHQLDAILEALHTEMEDLGTSFEVRMRREPGEERLRTFRPENYGVTVLEDANVIDRDGSVVRRRDQAAHADYQAVEGDDAYA